MRTLLVSPTRGHMREEAAFRHRHMANQLSASGRPYVPIDVDEPYWTGTIDLALFLEFASADQQKRQFAHFLRVHNVTEDDALVFNFAEDNDIPLLTLAYTYLAAFSRPNVSVVVRPAHRWMMGELFTERDVYNPPHLFNSLEKLHSMATS